MLAPKGFNYGAKLQSVNPFHTYSDGSVRMAFEEHLFEALATPVMPLARRILYFTQVDSRHHEEFKAAFDARRSDLRNSRANDSYYTYQSRAAKTDTIAANPTTRLTASPMVCYFAPRPRATSINQEEVDADIVFIKNIDNVLPDRLKVKLFVTRKRCVSFFRESHIVQHLEVLFFAAGR